MDTVKLKNGITVIYQPIDDLDILACNIFFPIGSSSDKVPGITSLSIRTGIKRSSKRDEYSFYSELERWGTPFIPDTSTDYSTIKFQTLPEGIGKVIELLLETVDSPDFSERSFLIEKETQLAAIRSRKESAFSLAFREILKRTYGNTPYEHLPNGEEETVSALIPEETKSWFKEITLPEKTVFSFAGKGDIENIIKALEEVETKRVNLTRFQVPDVEEGYSEVKREGSAQTFITLTFEAPSVVDRDYPLFRVVNTLLGEGIGSVMFQELREKKGYAYSAGSIYSARLKGGRLILYIGTSPEKEKQVLSDLKSLIRNLLTFVTSESVRRAKKYLIGNYKIEHETRSKLSWYFGFWETIGRGHVYDELFIKEVESISQEEVKSALEKLALSPYYTVVVKG